ncbi:hypothetical protein BGZ61DRAFT_525492 [Ilyonectria robusta]|uniref:uncharacterized protein n=1 Tax=Ilyonectria robusta TaxID=1079257 RepID=UPI001E8CBB55|nr:uncharacterized protein BGZ61DRAFT_525492 [Ilyonectria robusta]KAH8737342.1 hypothetical protein BGZ61DRAFT_525492 [Ilyonectria robusta]
MARGRKNIRRRRQRNPSVDLLGAAFGLPFLRRVHRAKRSVPHITIDYDSESDDADVVEESVASSDEDDDVSEAQSDSVPSVRTPRTPRRYGRRPSVASTSRKTPRRRSVSSRRATPVSSKRAAASFVQPSATFPSHMPVHLSSKPICMTQTPSSFPESALHPPFASLPVQSHQHMYYQPQFALVPAPAPVQIPQYATTSLAQPVVAYPQAVPHQPAQQPQEKPPNCASTSWAEGSGPFAQILERIQMDIDRKMTSLAEQPHNPVLRADLRKLQDQLNATLNAAIARKRASKEEIKPDLMSKLKSRPEGDRARFSKVVDDPPDPETRRNRTGGHSHITKQGTERNTEEKLREHIRESPEPIPSSHICSGCGCVRSVLFHENHPLHPEGRPIVNFCEVCRKRKIDRGVVGHYHFCFGCGQVRSKSFQCQHPTIPGDPILPNYCGLCLRKVRADEGIAETSILDLNSETDTIQGSGYRSAEDDDCDSLRAHIHSNHDARGSQGKSNRPKIFSTEEKSQEIGQEQVTRTSEHQPHNQPRHRHRPEPPNLKVHKSTPSQVDDSPKLPYCPTRNLSSAGRRAQRNSSGQANEEQDSRPTKTEAPRKYKAPFVEESKSAPQSRQGTPSPAFLSTNDLRKGKATNSDNGHGDPGFAANVDERPYSSVNSRSTREDGPPERTTTPLDKNIDSDFSAGSRKSSLKSSGSKTVRFKRSVDIRTPCSPDFKHDQSPIGGHHQGTGRKDSSRPPRPEISPLLSHPTKAPYGTNHDDKYAGGHHFDHNYGGPSVNRPAVIPNDFQGPSSTPRSVPSPGFSQGAFSKSFGSEPPRREDCDSPSARMNDFTSKSSRGQHAEEFPQTPKSQTSFRTSGFGSFFNKAGNSQAPGDGKKRGPSRSMASSPDSYRFQETARDH